MLSLEKILWMSGALSFFSGAFFVAPFLTRELDAVAGLLLGALFFWTAAAAAVVLDGVVCLLGLLFGLGLLWLLWEAMVWVLAMG